MTLNIKKSFFVALLLVGAYSTQAQERFFGQNGTIDISSDAPLELIEASSSKLAGALDPLTNEFAFQVKITSIEGFNSDLQRDHFNENYMESSKFPKAIFKGKIIEQIDLEADGVHNVRAKGKLTIHGVTQTRIIKTKLTIKGGKITAKTKFMVPLVDHDITIPKIVNQKIATEIDVAVQISLTQKE